MAIDAACPSGPTVNVTAPMPTELSPTGVAQPHAAGGIVAELYSRAAVFRHPTCSRLSSVVSAIDGRYGFLRLLMRQRPGLRSPTHTASSGGCGPP
jgi:hypothetical protein